MRTHVPTALRATLLAALLLAGAPALAQNYVVGEESCDLVTDHPCGLQIQQIELQDVPAIFKFQARVSQARLPVGDGTFSQIIVKLQRGGEEVCRETFAGVVVQDSVLNLEIGRNMTCDLAEEIAESASLQLRICLGGESNCLDPVDLGATPYAIKATYARLAQQAHHANVAAQAHYAHRATADRDLFLRKTLGTGYFDFYTHPQEDAQAVYPGDRDAQPEFQDGGFLQWAPVRGRTTTGDEAYTLHITGKDHDSDALRSLHRLVLDSATTEARGTLAVVGAATVGGTLGVVGDTTVGGALTVAGATDLQGPLTVYGPTISFSDSGPLGRGDGGRVLAHHAGDVLTINPQGDLAGGTEIQGSELTVTGAVGVGNGLTVTGATTLDSDLAFPGGVTVTGPVTFDGLVTFNGGSVDEAQLAAFDARFVNTTGDTLTGPLTAAGGLSVEGNTLLTGPTVISNTTTIAGALHVSGPLAELTVAGETQLTTLSAGATALGSLSVTGETTLTGLLHANGGLQVTDLRSLQDDSGQSLVEYFFYNRSDDDGNPNSGGNDRLFYLGPGVVPLVSWVYCNNIDTVLTNKWNIGAASWEAVCRDPNGGASRDPSEIIILCLRLRSNYAYWTNDLTSATGIAAGMPH